MLKRRARSSVDAMPATAAAAALAAKAVAADVMTDWGCQRRGDRRRKTTAQRTRSHATWRSCTWRCSKRLTPSSGATSPTSWICRPEREASKDAAAAAAAHAVLVSLYPDESQSSTRPCRRRSPRLPKATRRPKASSSARRRQRASSRCGLDDGSNAQESYRPFTKPGVYVPTALPIESTSGGIKPWVMEKGSQFRPASPPALDSEVWTRDVNEIRELGSSTARARTAGADGNRPVLVPDRSQNLPSARAAGCRSEEDGCRRLRPSLCPRLHGNQRRVHRRLRCQVRTQFLAADHGDPQRRPYLQSGHTARCVVDAAGIDAATSGVSLRALHRGCRGRRGAAKSSGRQRGRADAHEPARLPA